MDTATLATRLAGWNNRESALYVGLSESLHRLVVSGDLLPGTRMPSERALAGALDVSRGTVTAAYERLRSADILRGRRGSGTVVVGVGLPGRASSRAGVSDVLDTNVVSTALDSGAIDLRPSCWIDDVGLPEAALVDAVDDLRVALTGHGYLPAGLPELRAAIAERYSSSGLPTHAGQVLVTTGAQQAIQLVAQMALRPGDAVAVEDPTYIGALDSFAVLGARSIAIADRHRARLWYVMAEVHNPTGNTMSEDQRCRLVADACERGGLLVDDQAVAELWLGPDRPATLATIAEERGDAARVITIGSASKTSWGGLRVGWIRAATPVIDTLTRLKAVADVGSPIPSQLIANRLFPHLDRLIKARLEELRRRRDSFSKAVRGKLPEWSFEIPDGGLSLWIQIPGDATAFAAVAARNGVGVIPGPLCTAGSGHRDRIRVTFGLPKDHLIEASDRLAGAWSEFTAREPVSPRYEIVV